MKAEVVVVIRDDSDGVVFEGSREEALMLYEQLKKVLGKNDSVWRPTSIPQFNTDPLWPTFGSGSA